MQLPRLKEWREFRGLTQPELADRTGLSLRTVFNYEHGGNALPNNARKLAATLRVDIGDLISEEARPKGSAPPSLQASLFNGDVADEGRRFEVEALKAKRHAMRLLSSWRKFIDRTRRRWEVSESGPAIEQVRDVLDALETMIEAQVFEPAFGSSTDEFAEAERFELEMLYKGIGRLRELAEPVVADKDASRARRTFKVIDGLREAS